MEYGWIWIAVIVIAIVAEVITDQLVSIWFVPAAIIAVILDFINLDIIWQVLVFLVLSAAFIIIAKTVLLRISADRITKTNIDAIVGERCVVTEKIDNYAGCGQVRINGQIWSARGSRENDVFEVGETLDIVAIEGVKLICKNNKGE